MSVLIKFDQCIARPDEGKEKKLLEDHLNNVKNFMEQWVNHEEDIFIKLMGLSGICHDIAKAHIKWQEYIRDPQIKKGPAHAPAGAFLFSYLAYNLLNLNNKWKEYRVKWLWITRDIADHHGPLKKISNENWIRSWAWDKMDIKGIKDYLDKHYLEFKKVEFSIEILEEWLEDIYNLVEEALEDLDLGYDEHSTLELMEHLQLWRHITTGLISGDRFDVSSTDTFWLKKNDFLICDKNIEKFCQHNSKHPLSDTRINAQNEILKHLKESYNEFFFTLEMPTGYGKTITSLKIATWFGSNQGYKKIVYVAPYLSILEQTSNVIEEAMKIGVLEHHSLAIIENEKNHLKELEQRVPNDQLAMESWAHSIICTSFQQFSKALFPKTSQNVLRRAFLKDCVVIIDEPQIFNPNCWNVFLCGLEALAKQCNLKVLFLSATLPNFKYGLKQNPVKLSIKTLLEKNRYKIVNCEKMDEKKLANFLINNNSQTSAAILNTIEDAFKVYQEFNENDNNVHIIHGLMTPLHKKVEILKIKDKLNCANNKIQVISTQVLEAGVDVSFEHVVRALPILPSIVQAAGRVNRHFELKEGTLSVVPFYRGGEKNTRNFIYSKNLQRITDQLINKKDFWMESEMLLLIQQYYEEMFKENTYEAEKQAICDAYEGNWEELGRFQPFGFSYQKLPLFIPWKAKEEDLNYYPEQILKFQYEIGISDPEEIYNLYLDKNYINKLNFEERKKFMILFHYYVLDIPVKVALKFASKEDYLQNKIPILFDNQAYNQESGLTGHFNDEFDSIL